MLVTLDTDLATVLQWVESPPERRLRGRLATVPRGDVTTTIITYEEQTRGWLGRLSSVRSVTDQVAVYGKLNRHLEFFRGIRVLQFDGRAAVEFQRLRALKLRMGTMDLKIASVALANGAVLLTRNVADFRDVPALVIDDWSA